MRLLQQLIPATAIVAASGLLCAASEALTGGSLLPWPPQYKIKPVETRRLTPADAVGPDGLVNPNWTRCGVQGGIPEVKPFDTIEAYGGRADDDADDAPALERACEAAGRNGGGTVSLRAGTYRRYGTVIEKVEDSTVTLSQPLRLEFPVVDGSYVQKVVPIQRCGVADVYLDQTENLWISSRSTTTTSSVSGAGNW